MATKEENRAVQFDDQFPELGENSTKSIKLQTVENDFGEPIKGLSNAVQNNPQSELPEVNSKGSFQSHVSRLQKFKNFIEYHEISARELWGNKKNLSIANFANKVQDSFGFYLTANELSAIMSLTQQKETVKPSNFVGLGLWIKENEQQKEKILRNCQSNTIKVNRKHSCKTVNANAKGSRKQNIPNSNSKVNLNLQTLTSCQQNELSSYSNNFQEAKKYSEQKAIKKVQSLKQDIQNSILERKWDFLVMAAEMNQWVKQVEKGQEKNSSSGLSEKQLQLRYKVFNEERVRVVEENIVTNEEQEIPDVVFIKKYESLKKKMVKEENQKNNLKGTVIMVLDEKDKLNKQNLENRLNQRDQELNFVLLQVMRMKSVFEHQNKMLSAAGVNA